MAGAVLGTVSRVVRLRGNERVSPLPHDHAKFWTATLLSNCTVQSLPTAADSRGHLARWPPATARAAVLMALGLRTEEMRRCALWETDNLAREGTVVPPETDPMAHDSNGKSLARAFRTRCWTEFKSV